MSRSGPDIAKHHDLPKWPHDLCRTSHDLVSSHSHSMMDPYRTNRRFMALRGQPFVVSVMPAKVLDFFVVFLFRLCLFRFCGWITLVPTERVLILDFSFLSYSFRCLVPKMLEPLLLCIVCLMPGYANEKLGVVSPVIEEVGASAKIHVRGSI